MLSAFHTRPQIEPLVLLLLYFQLIYTNHSQVYNIGLPSAGHVLWAAERRYDRSGPWAGLRQVILEAYDPFLCFVSDVSRKQGNGRSGPRTSSFLVSFLVFSVAGGTVERSCYSPHYANTERDYDRNYQAAALPQGRKAAGGCKPRHDPAVTGDDRKRERSFYKWAKFSFFGRYPTGS